MTGACVSLIVTVKVQVALGLFGLASIAVQVTVVVPTGKNEPEGGEQLVVAPGQLSEAVGGGKLTTAPHWFGSLPCVMFAGQVIVGGCVSLTVIVNEQPDASSGADLRLNVPPPLPIQFTVVVPTGKNDPEGGEQVMVPQLPLIVGGG